MKRRVDLLDRLRNYLYDKAEVSEEFDTFGKENVIGLLDNLREYYRMLDFETGSLHEKIFIELYLFDGEKNYDETANQFGLHPYTLDRYRQRYNRLAQEQIDQFIKKVT